MWPSTLRQTQEVIDRNLIVRIERTWALDAAAFAEVLSVQDPSWGSEYFDLADGTAVLCGPGLYVNRALACGLTEVVDDTHLRLLELRGAVVGVPPAIEISDVTMPEVRQRVAKHGYRPADESMALIRRLDDVGAPDVDLTFVVERADGDLLSTWQETSARAWGHIGPDAIRASDAFARAAAVVDGPGFVLARSAGDGRPIGCASLTIRDGIATLGGMSTLPEERRRGVQSELIRYRLRRAREEGCEIATTTAAVGGVSERNLIRLGFRRSHTKVTFVRSF